MLKGRRIALVEDDEIMGGSIAQRLTLEGAEVIWLKLAQRAIGALRTPRAPIDAVICDIRLPDGTGEDVFTTLCRTMTPPPFLFITGQGGIDQAVRLLQAGAADYITKPFEMGQFLARLNLLLRTRTGEDLSGLLGVSPAAKRIEELALTAAQNDRPVLIRGASGTGKALVARRVHRLSDRASAPFEHVNLGRDGDALSLLQGAADRVRDGILFLNGLNRMGPMAQDWLMARLDASPQIRIVAACGSDMADLVKSGGFREDLYFRLDVFEIPIPPLKDRPDDAVWLLHRLFVALNASRTLPLRAISALADEAVRAHDWPGNGRELRARLVQAVETAVGDTIFPSDLFPEQRTAPDNPFPSLSEIRDVTERAHIVAALERTGGQATEAAKLLKISRTTLWEKMHKLGL
ncbi:MAG: sigma-54-dependent transcriptional regulator [Paracoccaceae bacterium]